jgi:SNF2-related domain
MNVSNAKYCERCYCYICDCLASDCQDWGTGKARAHHCNATAKSVTYRTQRQEHLRRNRAERANAPAAAPAPAPPSAAERAATEAAEVRAARQANVEAIERLRSSPFPAGRSSAPTQSAGGRDSPAPSSDSEPCNCPNCLHRRMEMMDSDGGVYGYDSDDLGYDSRVMFPLMMSRKVNDAPKACNLKQMPDPLLDPSMIELTQLTFEVEATQNNTIADLAQCLVPHGFYRPTSDSVMSEMGDKLTLGRLVTEMYSNGRNNPAVLKITPTQLTPAPAEPSPTRVVPIRVHFWDGRALPTIYGVEITPGFQVYSMMKSLRTMLQLDATIEVHLQWTSDYAAVIKMEDRITDEWLTEKVFIRGDAIQLDAFCLPVRREPYHPNVRVDTSVAAMLNFLPTNAFDNPYTVGDNSKAIKLVVPMTPIHEGGGPAAKVDVAYNTIKALRQYRLNPDDENETRSLITSIRISWGYRNSYNTPSFEQPPENHMMRSRYRRVLSGRSKAVGLKASFTAEVMEASFKPETWEILPVIDPSAAPNSVNPTRNYIKELKIVRRANAEERSLPERILQEIEAASAMKDISTIPAVNTLATPHIGPSALVRYKAQLTPLVEEPEKGKGKGAKKKVTDPKKGLLRIRVFVFRTAGRNRIGFFDQGSEWGGATVARGRNHRMQRNIVPHRIKNTLWYHLRENSEFIAVEDHRKQWAATDEVLSAQRSITALMEAMERPEAPAAVQPNGLTVTLRPYQLQSLKFMWDEELGVGGFRRHLWVPALAVDGTPFWYSPLLGRVASTVAEQAAGGFCCEEMGLGKTVEVLALVLANPAPTLPAPGTMLPSKKLHSRATLVVCAVSLVGQWIAEAEEKTGGSLKIHMYHGQGRIKDARRLATEFDLVVTTYATLSSDCGNKKGGGRGGGNGASGSKKDTFTVGSSPLHEVQWHRLVLDESHTCKNPAVGHTKACVALEAKRRWMCTGTPINTDVQDLYGQFAVLGFAPYNNRNFFDSNVKNAFGNNVYDGGCPELLHALGAIMVRHTKRQELGGEQVLQLPPKTEELVPGKKEKLILFERL